MRNLPLAIAVVMVFAFASPAAAQVDERRWLIQASDNKIVGMTDDYSLLQPYDPGTFSWRIASFAWRTRLGLMARFIREEPGTA